MNKQNGITLIKLTFATCLCFSTATAAEFYKCTDQDGRVTFSQTVCSVSAEPITINQRTPTPEEVLKNDMRIANEKAELDAERERRYRLWLSGKYLGGHNTYTETVTIEGYGANGYYRKYAPEYHYKAPITPRQENRNLGSSAATIGGSHR